MTINIKSIFISGLAAGFIIVLSALTMVPVVGNQMDEVLASRGLPPLSVPDMIYFTALSFFFGISLVWFYALAKRQMGPGIKTALAVAAVFWFYKYFLGNLANVVYGFMPVQLTVIGTVWGLGELLLGGVVGAKLYKDPA